MTPAKLGKSKRSENIILLKVFLSFVFRLALGDLPPSLTPLVFLSLQLLPSRRREEKEREKRVFDRKRCVKLWIEEVFLFSYSLISVLSYYGISGKLSDKYRATVPPIFFWEQYRRR